MVGKANSGIILGIINVTCQYSCTVTATNGNLSFTLTGTSVSFKLPRTGAWVITAVYNGMTQTQTVTLTPGMVANITVRHDFYLYNRGVFDSAFNTQWSSGAQANCVSTEGSAWGAGSSITIGSFDITQFKTVAVEVSGVNGDSRYGTSNVFAEIMCTDGNTILQSHNGGQATFNTTTWTFDTNSINGPVRFRIRTYHVSGGSKESGCYAKITLYSIRVVSR